MQKTLLLLTLAASLGLSYAADSNSQTKTATLIYSNTEAASKEGAQLMTKNTYGVVFTLKSEPSRLAVSCPDLTEIPSFSAFNLQSIGVQAQTGTTTNYQWHDVGAFLIDNTTKKVLAHARNIISSVTAGDMATFEFDSLTLNTDTSYRLLFVPSDLLNAADIEIGKIMTGNFCGRYYTGSLGGQSTGTASDCNLALGFSSVMDTDYAPVVSIQGQVLIPEPTTATLSLLALAGLAARRRRK